MTNDIPVSLDLVLNQLRYFLPVVLNGCCGSRFHKSDKLLPVRCLILQTQD